MAIRLAVISPQISNYHTPLYRRIAQEAQVSLSVYYCDRLGVEQYVDPGFGIPVEWNLSLDGVPHTFLRNRSLFPTPNHPLGLFNPQVFRIIRRDRFDAVMVVGYASATSWLSLAAARRAGLPVLFWGETVVWPEAGWARAALKRLLVGYFLHRCAVVLPVGTRSRQLYLEYGIPAERMFSMPDSINNDFFRSGWEQYRLERIDTLREAGVPTDLPVVLYVGKFTPRKRPLDALKAFQPLAAKASLLMVGDGEQRSLLEDYIEEHEVPHVRLIGFRDQSEIRRLYAASDIFVFPSSYEPWGLVVNEAMCNSLPVIATAGVASAADLVQPGENGYVVPVGDVTAMSSRLDLLISNHDLRVEMGKRSWEIISGWNYDACLSGLLAALDFACESD